MAELVRSVGGGASFAAAIAQGAIPRIPSVNSGADATFEDSKLRTVEVTITSAQLKALRATAVEVIPAPGAGKVIDFISAQLAMIFGTAAYTENSGTCNLGFKFTDASGVQVNETVEATGFVDQVVSAFTHARAKLDPIVLAAGCVNKALVIHNVGSAELITGDGVLKLRVLYAVQSST